MYYDKLERVNYFLKDMACLVEAGEPEDSRLVQHLLREVMGDGGQWTMAMNVYKKYGAVPKDLFPETESSKNTDPMNNKLCKLLRQAVAHMYENPENIDQIVKNATEAGHRILTIHLGERRSPSTGSGPTRTTSSTVTARSRRSSSGRSTWVPPIWKAMCVWWTIRVRNIRRDAK